MFFVILCLFLFFWSISWCQTVAIGINFLLLAASFQPPAPSNSAIESLRRRVAWRTRLVSQDLRQLFQPIAEQQLSNNWTYTSYIIIHHHTLLQLKTLAAVHLIIHLHWAYAAYHLMSFGGAEVSKTGNDYKKSMAWTFLSGWSCEAHQWGNGGWDKWHDRVSAQLIEWINESMNWWTNESIVWINDLCFNAWMKLKCHKLFPWPMHRFTPFWLHLSWK